MPGRDKDFDMVVLVSNELLEALLHDVFECNSARDHLEQAAELACENERERNMLVATTMS
jgi:hypothetical protein